MNPSTSLPRDPEQLNGFVHGRKLMALDPLNHSCRESSNKLLQYHQLNNLFGVLLLCHQPLVTGVLQLLQVGKGVADLRELQ